MAQPKEKREQWTKPPSCRAQTVGDGTPTQAPTPTDEEEDISGSRATEEGRFRKIPGGNAILTVRDCMLRSTIQVDGGASGVGVGRGATDGRVVIMSVFFIWWDICLFGLLPALDSIVQATIVVCDGIR